MQVLEIADRQYTPEEYLCLEATAEGRNEYCNGAIIPMTGGSTNHNRISLNLAGSINLALAQTDHEVFMANESWINRPAIGDIEIT